MQVHECACTYGTNVLGPNPVTHVDNCALVGRPPSHSQCPSVCLSFHATLFTTFQN